MNLLLDLGTLCKPYARPFDTRTGEHAPAPPGWTPDRDEWIMSKAYELQHRGLELDTPLPLELALQAAEELAGERLAEARQPWPGWVPIIAQQDRAISRAYLELFKAMGHWPRDGRYVFNRGAMERVEGDSGS